MPASVPGCARCVSQLTQLAAAYYSKCSWLALRRPEELADLDWLEADGEQAVNGVRVLTPFPTQTPPITTLILENTLDWRKSTK
jgi:hypothetical protein